jgi:sec-independent protein translocase protein TatC
MAGKAGRSAHDATRMPLMEHIRELRNRLIKAALAVVLGGVGGFLLRDRLINVLQRPVCSIRGVEGIGRSTPQCRNGVLTLTGPTAGISLAFDIAIFSGLVLASPVWLYQLWAFLAPGLYKNEKRYSLGFIAAAVPLFLCGAAVCYSFFPTIMRVLLAFTPSGVVINLPLDQTLIFFLRMMVVFGASFVLPLILVLLNVLGILSAARMRHWWRGIVLAIFVFSAVAVPTGDPVGMSVLAIPICLLYFAAIAVATLNDRRRARRRAADLSAQPPPDQASALDLTPAPVARPVDLEHVP